MACLEQELSALFDTHKVPTKFRAFLEANNCLDVHSFSSAAAEEKKIESDIIEASGIPDFTGGEKLSIKVAWRKARGMCPSESGSGPATAMSKSRMPEGIEAALRAAWHNYHHFHVQGGWLAIEDSMTKM